MYILNEKKERVKESNETYFCKRKKERKKE